MSIILLHAAMLHGVCRDRDGGCRSGVARISGKGVVRVSGTHSRSSSSNAPSAPLLAARLGSESIHTSAPTTPRPSEPITRPVRRNEPIGSSPDDVMSIGGCAERTLCARTESDGRRAADDPQLRTTTSAASTTTTNPAPSKYRLCHPVAIRLVSPSAVVAYPHRPSETHQPELPRRGARSAARFGALGSPA